MAEGQIRFEEQIENMLLKLNNLYDEYEILNKKTNGRFRYRQNGIELQISVLDALKNNWDFPLEDWDLCLAEDKRESGVK